MAKVISHLWFADRAEEAVRLYTSVIPGSSIDRTTTMPADSPSGPPGSVKVIEFTLSGQPFMALEAAPLDPFNHSYSIVVECDSQAEIDRIWNALLDGGSAEQCGWLRDRYGLSWQVVPRALGDMMADPDHAKAKQVAEAMLQMVKLDLPALERAYASAPGA